MFSAPRGAGDPVQPPVGPRFNPRLPRQPDELTAALNDPEFDESDGEEEK